MVVIILLEYPQVMEGRNQKNQVTEESHELVPSHDQVPDDVYFNILSRLPLHTLLVSKSVCKRWFSLIEDPIFTKIHSERSKFGTYIFERDDIYMDGSLRLYSINREGVASCVSANALPHCHARVAHCYGLLCFRTQVNRTFLVCNPSTRAWLELPKSSCFSATFGFGFNSLRNTYVVVQLSYWGGCQVFTLGTSSWRQIDSRPVNFNISGESFFFNGALHWNGHGMIISFHLETEMFGVIPYPDNAVGFFRDLHELEGCLCMISGLVVVNQNIFDFWLLKDYVNHVWVKLSFELPLVIPGKGEPRVVIQNGEILATSHHTHPTQNYLHSYNTQNHLSNTIELPRSLSDKSILMIGNYVMNLISVRNR